MEFQTGGTSKIWPEDKQFEICFIDKIESVLSDDEELSSLTDWIKLVNKSLIGDDSNSKSI